MKRSLILVLTLAFLWPISVSPQDPDLPFRDRIDVEVVNVDVTVVGRNGKIVRDLSQGDFTLIVDGKKIPVQYFDAPDDTSGPDESVVVLIDNRHLSPELRNQALVDIEASLLRLAQAGCQIKVVSYSGVLQVLQPFTRDETKIRVALARATRSGSEASKRLWKARQVAVNYVTTATRSFSRNPPPLLIEQTHKAVMAQLRGFAELEYEDGKELLDSLRLMVVSLGGISGHKTVLLLSDGIALQPVDRVFDRFLRPERRLSQVDPSETRAPEEGHFGVRSNFSQSIVPGGAQEWRKGYEGLNLTEDVASLTQAANVGGVTLHTIPLTSTFLSEVERSLQYDLGQDRFVVSELDDALKMMANQTGGRAHDRAAAVADFLGTAEEEIPSSYSLGFVPAAPDDLYHEIKVKVRGRGLRIRHRPGYVARSFAQRLATRTLAALTLDMVPNPHRLGLEVQDVKQIGDGVNEVSLLAYFPIEKLSLTSDGRNYFADLWAAATYLEPNGQIGEIRQIQIPLSIPVADLESALEQDFAAVLTLTMPTGSVPTAIGLWNRTSDRGSFIAGNVEVLPQATPAD